MGKQAKLIDNLKSEIPEFLEFFEIDDENPYIVIGNLGLFIEKVHNSIYKIVKYGKSSQKVNHDLFILSKIFNYLNKVYDHKDKDIENIIDVSIWELLITLQYGYKIAKEYMSENMYLNFIKEYPYEKHKLNWNTE